MDAGPSLFYIPGDLKPDEIKPWVGGVIKERAENFGRDDPQVRCIPEGPRFNREWPLLAIESDAECSPSSVLNAIILFMEFPLY
jgi:hypothetical protein